MTALDDLPTVSSFFGFDLKTGAVVIAALGIVHPMAYGCSCFIPMSYLLVTVWILVALFFAASVGLFCGLLQGSALLCAIWVWYTVIFVALMIMLMILLALVFTSRRQSNRVFVVILGMLWYILTIYFVLVVNSHRKSLEYAASMENDVCNNKSQSKIVVDTSTPPTRTPEATTITTTKESTVVDIF